MTILSGHQPVYLPGIILFNKMAMSDMFMFVGHVQFSNKSWQQRNRIKLGGQELLLSVPVKKAGCFGDSIDEMELTEDPWRRKHLGSIQQAYQKRPFFRDYYPALAETLNLPHRSVGEMNKALILLIKDWLGITTPIVESRDYLGRITGAKTDMLMEMCQAVGADRYLSNEGSRVYVEEDRMAAAGIWHCWQEFEHPVYDQGGPFLRDMSVIDLLFNVGPAAGEMVHRAGRVAAGAFPPLGHNVSRKRTSIRRVIWRPPKHLKSQFSIGGEDPLIRVEDEPYGNDARQMGGGPRPRAIPSSISA